MAGQHDVCNTTTTSSNTDYQQPTFTNSQQQFCINQQQSFNNNNSSLQIQHQNQCLPNHSYNVNYRTVENNFPCTRNRHFPSSNTTTSLIQNFKSKNGYQQSHHKYDEAQYYQTDNNVQQNVEYNQRNYQYPFMSDTNTNYQNYPSQYYLQQNVFSGRMNEMNMLVPTCQSSGSSETSDDSCTSNVSQNYHNMRGVVKNEQVLYQNQINFNFPVPVQQQQQQQLQLQQVRNCLQISNYNNKDLSSELMAVINDGNIPRCDSNKSETAESTCSSFSSGSMESQTEDHQQQSVVHLPLIIDNLTNTNLDSINTLINRTHYNQFDSNIQTDQQDRIKLNRNAGSNILLIPNNVTTKNNTQLQNSIQMINPSGNYQQASQQIKKMNYDDDTSQTIITSDNHTSEQTVISNNVKTFCAIQQTPQQQTSETLINMNNDVKMYSLANNVNNMSNNSATITNKLNNNQHLTCLKVPLGWRRILVDGSIIYLSPSNIALSTLEQVKLYLQTSGTCKCGLECPFDCDSVFNFDPKVVSGPWNPLDSDLTKLCNHKRKSNCLPVENQNNLIKQEEKVASPVKRKKKKNVASYGPTSVYQLLAQRERQLAAAGASQPQARWQPQPPPLQPQQPQQVMADSLPPMLQQPPPPPPPHLLQQQQQQQQFIGYPAPPQNGQFLLMPNMQQIRPEMKQVLATTTGPPRQTIQFPVPDQTGVGGKVMQKPRSIPPWHQTKLGDKKPPHAIMYDRVPPLQQHMPQQPPLALVGDQLQRKKHHKTKGKKRSANTHEFQPSFMDDPNAYLAQQTALLHNTISRPNFALQESVQNKPRQCQNPCCSGGDDSVTSSGYNDNRPIQGGAISTSNGSPQASPKLELTSLPAQSPAAAHISSTSNTPFIVPVPVNSPRSGGTSASTSPKVDSPKYKQVRTVESGNTNSCNTLTSVMAGRTTQTTTTNNSLGGISIVNPNINILKSSLEVVHNIVTPQNIMVRTNHHHHQQQGHGQTSTKSPGHQSPAGILVANNGQYIVTSSGNIVPQTNLLSPPGGLKLSHHQGQLPPTSVSQVIPTVAAQQVLTQPTVLVNTIPTPFMIQPGVMTVDTTHHLTVATGNMLQSNLGDGVGDKSKKKGKKRKNQVNLLQMTSPNGVILNQPFAVSPTQQQPLLQTLTLLPNKQPTSQIVMNSSPAQQINVLQPVSLTSVPTIQQFILPGLGNVVMSTDGTTALLPDNLSMQLQNVLTPMQNTGFINSQGILTTSAGMLIRTPNHKLVQQNSPQFLSPNNQFLVNGTFQGQLSPLITTNLSPNQQIFQNTSPRSNIHNNQSPAQEYIQIVPTSSSQNNTTVVQQNTTIVQQQTTMVSNNNIMTSPRGQEKKKIKDQTQHSVSTQTFVNQPADVGLVITTNNFCQQTGSSPPDTTTHSPADTTTTDDGSMVQYVSSSIAENDLLDNKNVVESSSLLHGFRISVTDENMVSSHTDMSLLDKHVSLQQAGKYTNTEQQTGDDNRGTTTTTTGVNTMYHQDQVSTWCDVREGDLVWGSANGSPAWPGKLIRPISPGGRGLVKWFGGQSSSPPTRVHVSHLQTLSQGLEAHHRASNKHRKSRKLNSQLESAIQEAMLELDKMTAQQKKVNNGQSRTRRTHR